MEFKKHTKQIQMWWRSRMIKLLSPLFEQYPVRYFTTKLGLSKEGRFSGECNFSTFAFKEYNEFLKQHKHLKCDRTKSMPTTYRIIEHGQADEGCLNLEMPYDECIGILSRSDELFHENMRLRDEQRNAQEAKRQTEHLVRLDVLAQGEGYKDYADKMRDLREKHAAKMAKYMKWSF